MFSYKFLVRAEKNNALRLRLTSNRKMVEISLGVSLPSENLSDALSENPKPENIKWRSLFSKYQSALDEIKCDLLKDGRTNVPVSEIKELVLDRCFNKVAETKDEKPQKVTFASRFQSFADGKINEGTKGVYKHTLDRIRLFDPDVDRKLFEDIDLKWLTEFEAFCAKTASKNARNVHLRNIRAVFNNAIDYGITSAYPFRRFKIRPEATRKRSLSVKELRELFNYPVEPYAEIYRDMFKLVTAH